jgi:hypothetical protein
LTAACEFVRSKSRLDRADSRFSACGYAAVQDAPAPTGRRLNSPEIPDSPAAFLEHDPEKWEPVFRKDHAQTKR